MIIYGFLGFLALSTLIYIILPHTRWIERITPDSTTFRITHVFAIIYALISLVMVASAPEVLLRDQLWLVLVTPFIVLTFYWLITKQQLRSAAVYEARQLFATARIASMVFVFGCVGMFIMLVLYQNRIVGGEIWLPLYIFITILVNSTISLIVFRHIR